jgi:hypothetical protein
MSISARLCEHAISRPAQQRIAALDACSILAIITFSCVSVLFAYWLRCISFFASRVDSLLFANDAFTDIVVPFTSILQALEATSAASQAQDMALLRSAHPAQPPPPPPSLMHVFRFRLVHFIGNSQQLCGGRFKE